MRGIKCSHWNNGTCELGLKWSCMTDSSICGEINPVKNKQKETNNNLTNKGKKLIIKKTISLY